MAWDLTTEYSQEFQNEIREKFEKFKKELPETTSSIIQDHNDKHNLKVGDKILFRNGFDVELIAEILGFEFENRVYLLWDCYWFSISLDERLISKVN